MSRRILITAGSSREMIDRVRDWGNIFTGNTGFNIAQAFVEAGAQVDLITSNAAHLVPRPSSLATTPYRSHRDLIDAIATKLRESTYNAVFMTAAVADYAPAGAFEVVSREPQADGTERWIVRTADKPKVTSQLKQLAVLGDPTEKIVDKFRRDWHYRGLLVKFKLEVGLSREQLVAVGQKSRVHSGADYLVANTLDMVDGANAGAILLGDGVEEFVPRSELATRLTRLL
jgi:phosphopantothenate-cysteine ligase/phosphopantothenoylcysteine decarboxylase/phosphopantothenate--cysteine ligase